MERILGFADKSEANLTATALLATATARIAALETELTDLKASSADGVVTITNLTAQIATAEAATAAKDTELKNVQAELATAKGTANAVIASQGLAADKLPPLEPRAQGSDEKTLSLTDRCIAAKAGNGQARN